MKVPAWRIWLTTFSVCGWGILFIRFIQKGDPAFAAVCALLFLVNAYFLWQMTRQNR